MGASAPAPLRDGEADELFNPPQTECSRITPCPLPCLYTRFHAIGAYWCYPVAYLNRKSEIGKGG